LNITCIYKILLLVLFVINLNAQNSWTIKGGLSHSNFRDENESNSINSFSIGISKNIPISDNFSISAELFVTTQGGILKNKLVYFGEFFADSVFYAFDIKAVATYLEIPLLLNYSVYNFSKNNGNIYLFFGPSYRFAIDHSSTLSNRRKTNEDYRSKNFDYSAAGDWDNSLPSPLFVFVNERGLSLNIGFVYNHPFLIVETRYTYTMREMEQIGQIDAIGNHLNSIHLLIGFNL